MVELSFHLHNSKDKNSYFLNEEGLELPQSEIVSNFMKGSKILQTDRLKEVEEQILSHVSKDFNSKKLQISKWNCQYQSNGPMDANKVIQMLKTV